MPMPVAEPESGEKRSAITLGSDTVVALNVMPPTTDTTASTANARITTWRGIWLLFLAAARLGAGRSGTIARNATPTRMPSRPGSTNAARQPTRSTSAPVASAANATPRLPHTPLMPSARPSWPACAVSIAVPTGW